ncbi:MAG: ABC transporter substrate-binding protein [Deltaproteobacteria bacterium]|nr:ABC transporter substrate-binding protein [Deltaproteobacteria bacterium]
MARLGRRAALGLGAALALSACRGRRRLREERSLVLLHQPLWGDVAPFGALLDEFRRAHPDVRLVARAVPSASDVLHQYLLTTLEGGGEVDVFVADAIWVPEFARTGWIADVSAEFPERELRRDFVGAAADTVLFDGRTWALPWWTDVGVLYTRTDVTDPPHTFDGLVAAARRSRVGGYVFQGRQYEGLVCNAYEVIWGFGGATMDGARIVVDTKEAREALSFLASLVRDGVSPRAVTSAGEEECRRTFESGRAALMRNWPYAWAELQRTPLRGRVAMTAVPSRDGSAGHGCLGGWQLAMSARVPAWKRPFATALMRHLSSHAAQETLARVYGRPPSRRALYENPALPTLALLAPIIEHARPRPVSPWYPRVSDVLQGELSAIVSGIRAPHEALSRAQRQIDRLAGESA